MEPPGFLSWESGWVAMAPTVTGLTAGGPAPGEPGRRRGAIRYQRKTGYIDVIVGILFFVCL